MAFLKQLMQYFCFVLVYEGLHLNHCVIVQIWEIPYFASQQSDYECKLYVSCK